MKPLLASLLALAFAGAAIRAAPADDVKAAAKKLADAPNYAFTATTQFGNSPPFAINGVSEKGGYSMTRMTVGENTRRTVRKGDVVVMQGRDGEWMTLEEIRQQFGNPGRSGGMFGGAPVDHAKEIADLADTLSDITLIDGAISGTLTAEGVRRFFAASRSPSAPPPPAPKNAAGLAKIWLKDGAIAKYVVELNGTIALPNGDEREVERTTTTEIKDVGTTKVEIPEPAKKKLGS